MVTGQMAADLVILGIGARIILGAAMTRAEADVLVRGAQVMRGGQPVREKG